MEEQDLVNQVTPVDTTAPFKSPIWPMVIAFFVFMMVFVFTQDMLDERARASVLLLCIPIGIVATLWREHNQTTGSRTVSLQTGVLAFIGASIILGAFIAVSSPQGKPPLLATFTLIFAVPALCLVGHYFNLRRRDRGEASAFLKMLISAAGRYAIYFAIFGVIIYLLGGEWALHVMIGMSILGNIIERLVLRMRQRAKGQV